MTNVLQEVLGAAAILVPGKLYGAEQNSYQETGLQENTTC